MTGKLAHWAGEDIKMREKKERERGRKRHKASIIHPRNDHVCLIRKGSGVLRYIEAPALTSSSRDNMYMAAMQRGQGPSFFHNLHGHAKCSIGQAGGIHNRKAKQAATHTHTHTHNTRKLGGYVMP
jgi:hypothetical protein